jgi:hypothetical protein
MLLDNRHLDCLGTITHRPVRGLRLDRQVDRGDNNANSRVKVLQDAPLGPVINLIGKTRKFRVGHVNEHAQGPSVCPPSHLRLAPAVTPHQKL